MNLGEIAKHLNVSPASVSIVRGGRPGVSPGMRKRIQDLLAENGYSYKEYAEDAESPPVPQPGRRFIRLIKYRKSALLTDKNEGFVDAIIDSVDANARLRGYGILINAVSHGEYENFLDELSREACAGLLIVATEMDREEICKLERLRVPTVILDSDHAALPFCTVTMNNRDLAYGAVSYLFSLGHPRVGHLRSSIPTGNFVERANGYREALSDRGMGVDEAIVFRLRPSAVGAHEDMLGHLLAARPLPSAVFADNDIIAVGAMRALAERGYNIPRDISVIGVDNTPLSHICTPPLSTMQISRAALGEKAFTLLLERIQNPRAEIVHIRVGSYRVDRESVESKANA